MSDVSKHFRARYKNANLDSDELRKRREEMSISLRKQKREEHVLKLSIKYIL